MILPIVPYGDPVLRQRGAEVAADHPGLAQLIADLYETMYNAEGVGLAAPQVGHSLRLFVVDTKPMAERNAEDRDFLATFRQTFLNPTITAELDEPWGFEEGCLSIPGIREEVQRRARIQIKWQDEQFQWHEREFTGLAARVIQHEYDHIEGKLFVDHISPLRKQLIRSKLTRIQRGFGEADYPLRKLSKAASR